MKKSRIAKFALLGASCAALAATLSTSTYAWYVSNKTATVEQLTGNTASAAADGSITLSWSGNDDTWFSSLKWSDQGAPTVTPSLFPVHYDGSAYKKGQFYEPLKTWAEGTHYVRTGVNTYVAATNEQNVAANIANLYTLSALENANTAHYVTFSLWIKSSSANTTITPQVVFTNTTQNIATKAQVAYKPTGTIEQNSTFVVDALRSMYYKVVIDESGDTTDTTTKYGAPATSSYLTTGVVAPGDAHTYYEAVSGAGVKDTEVASDVTTAANQFGNFTVGTTKTKLTFTIWLEGADADCYNSCAEQTFAFDLTFKA